jgi:acetolactate synthase-1/2/3 large subunit
VGAQAAGPKAKAQLELGRPDVDFVAIGNGLGVPSRRVASAEELMDALRDAIAEPGPHLIEAPVPTMFTPLQLRAMPRALRALERLPRPLAAAIKRRVYP